MRRTRRRLHGAAEFRAFLQPFTGILLEANLLAAFGDESKALIMYDTRTIPVTSAPAAELLTVENGLIVANTFIFDRAPFDAARAAAPPADRSPLAAPRRRG